MVSLLAADLPRTAARPKPLQRVLLISTYELGHQPFGLAEPIAWLRRAGHDVRALDLAVEIVTDPTVEASRAAVQEVRSASSLPVLIGGRATAETVSDALDCADGVIVGTCLRHSARTDQPLDPDAVSRFMEAARSSLR